ncbi:MAG: DUF3592 domain-containing protein [Acidobacteria bacterium]|nr:DUF3592 domain-containing protein [Acidobacteriota bacterium]
MSLRSIHLIPMGLAVVGASLLTGAVFTYRSTQAFLTRSVPDEGTVVSNERRESESSNGKRSYSFYPVVEFQTPDGKGVKFTASSGSRPPSYSRGDRVPIRYDPSDPNVADIDSFVSRWLGTLALGVMGVAFVAFGIVIGACIARSKS